jgi:hypothetical protein
MYIDRVQPWHERLFALYLLAVIFIALYRAARLAIELWITRAKAAQSIPVAELIIRNDRAIHLTRMFKNISLFTFLIALIEPSLSGIDACQQIATQKTVGFHAVAGALAESLASFCAGVIVCTFSFSLALIFENLLNHRRQRLDSRGNNR